MDGILSTTAAAGEIVFVDCKGILVPQLKNSQLSDHNVLHSCFLDETLGSLENNISKDFMDSNRKKELDNITGSFFGNSSEIFTRFSLSKILSELPPVDELGRIIYNADSDNIQIVPKVSRSRARFGKSDKPFGFIFTGPSLGSDPSFVEISLEDSFANEEQDSFEIYSNDVSSATAPQTLANGIRTLGNKVRGFFARTFPKRLNADKI